MIFVDEVALHEYSLTIHTFFYFHLWCNGSMFGCSPIRPGSTPGRGILSLSLFIFVLMNKVVIIFCTFWMVLNKKIKKLNCKIHNKY